MQAWPLAWFWPALHLARRRQNSSKIKNLMLFRLYIMRNGKPGGAATRKPRSSRKFKENKVIAGYRFRLAREACWLTVAQAAKEFQVTAFKQPLRKHEARSTAGCKPLHRGKILGMKTSTTIAAAFYHFATLPDFVQLQAPLKALCDARHVTGTILLAAEGVNGTIAGAPENVRAVLDFLRSDPRLAALEHKESPAEREPFHRMKVRLKREIVTLGVPGLDPASQAGTYVEASDWNALIDDPDVVLVDTRNDYEVAIGSFPGAMNPDTRSFRELPQWLEQHPELHGKKVAMFCTGGIRCEKSTALLRSRGFDEVFHLKGGILKYLETVPAQENRWQGECFVFDERVSVGHGLVPGQHTLCRSCRHPLNEEDRTSSLYEEGISCAHCHHTLDAQRRASLAERQRQVVLAEQRGQRHVGMQF